PPVWVIARKSVLDDTISGFHLPASSTVLINVYGMNTSSAYWHSPQLFNPDRFHNNKEQRQPFTYIPFGGGQRVCIGHLFAMMVMQTVVCKLVREFEFDIPTGFKPVIDPNITLRVKGGIRLLVTHNSINSKINYANA
ncbi:MAG: cytochrome P450, partial [Chitinophagaceae bacterium]